MTIDTTLSALEQSTVAIAIAESPWMFPTLETVHVLALAIVVGSIWMVDARLLGWGSRSRSIREVTATVLPWTWCAFGVALLSGSLMFTSHAVKYFGLWPFKVKMLCMLLAALNMLAFHFVTARDVAAWDHGKPPLAAKGAGAASMLIWVIVVGTGRWIGFL